MLRIVFSLALSAFIIAISDPSAVAQFRIVRSTVDGGGIMRSTGGKFELSGTIGQPDAGLLMGGEFELNGGFWFPVTMADCNEDGAVSLADHGSFVDCLSGPSISTDEACVCFDLDQDGSVDLEDFAALQHLLVSS